MFSLFKLYFCLVLIIVPIVVECKAPSLFISVDIPSSGSVPHFEAIGAFEFYFIFFSVYFYSLMWCIPSPLLLPGLLDATGAYPVTESYGAQCGYTYSVQPLLGLAHLRASYFSCHTGNQVQNPK